MSILRRIELAWLSLCAASAIAVSQPIDALLAAIVGIAALELMKVM